MAKRLPASMTRPPLADVLVLGGDTRLTLGPDGRNAYGCQPRPEPDVSCFGSATASVISPTVWQAMNAAHQTLTAELAAGAVPADLYQQQIQYIGQEIQDLCGLQPDFSSQKNNFFHLFAASGTDVHLIAAELLRRLHPAEPQCIIVMDEHETGSQVPLALQGRHFSTHAAYAPAGDLRVGAPVLPQSPPPRVVSVRLRHASTRTRSMAEIEAEISQQVATALQQGERVLLCIADVSKTGLQAPRAEFAHELRQRHAERLDVLVDACQFRLAQEAVREHLGRGFLVALTGSKLLGAPSFCGILLGDALYDKAFSRISLSAADGLSYYLAQGDIPAHWALHNQLPARSNFGLLLRWQGALANLRRLRQIPEATLRQRIHAYTGLLRDALQAHGLAVVDHQLPDITPTFPNSIVTFTQQNEHGEWLTQTTAKALQHGLRQHAPRYHLGQGVVIGQDQQPVYGLRVCLSLEHVQA